MVKKEPVLVGVIIILLLYLFPVTSNFMTVSTVLALCSIFSPIFSDISSNCFNFRVLFYLTWMIGLALISIGFLIPDELKIETLFSDIKIELPQKLPPEFSILYPLKQLLKNYRRTKSTVSTQIKQISGKINDFFFD